MSWRFKTNDPSLGSGGFGEVFACHRIDANGTVIDDQLAVKLCVVGEDEDADEMQKRFRNGGKLGKRLRHRNILKVVATGDRTSDGMPYIVMPLADGGNVDDWLKAEQPGEAELVDVFRQIIEAMAFAHSQNILHRDIKAENILFVGGVPQVADFDLAKDIGLDGVPGITMTNVGIGTRGYMAPEQWVDLKRVGPPADVFGLGRLWWRMLSGRQPCEGTLDLRAVPAQWRSLIDKACEYRAHERYGTAGEMLRAFESLVAAPPGTPMQTAQELAEKWNGDEPEKHWKTLKALDEHFQLHPDDDALHAELAPFLPSGLLDQWMADHPGGFSQMVRGVDEASSGSLLWDDCDGFARFYIQVFEKSEDDALRCRAIEQVLRIGALHNRYPVANMFRAALSRLDKDADAEIVARAARNQPQFAVWFHIQPTCHPVIVSAFADPTGGD